MEFRISVMKLTPSITRAFRHLSEYCRVDIRSLALFRILLGLVVLADLIQRVQQSTVFHSDAGVLPRRLAIPVLSAERWSLLFLNGTPGFSAAFITVGIVLAIAMVLGYRTRIVTIALWVVVVSVQARNNHLLSGADTLIRLSMFWAMWLPLGAAWSIDRVGAEARSMPPTPRAHSISSAASFAIILQCAFVYLFTALQKDGDRWREDSTALYYALGARDLTRDSGEWLFQNAPAWFFSFFTTGTMLMEFAVPILLLLPIRTAFLRTVAVLLVVMLHTGIGLTMEVGLFPLISIASISVVLPSQFWESLSRSRIVSTAIASLRFKLRNVLPVGAASVLSETRPNSLRSESPSEETHPSAVHFLYSGPGSAQGLRSIAINFAVVLSIVLMFCWNLTTVSSYTMPEPLRQAAVATGTYQNWSMFSPNPQMSTVWFVASGNLQSGEEVDILTPIRREDVSLRLPVVMDQSEHIQNHDKYWRKYFHAIYKRDADTLAFAAYACRTWNADNSGEDRLKTVTLTRGYSQTLTNSERADPVLEVVGSWDCT